MSPLPLYFDECLREGIRLVETEVFLLASLVIPVIHGTVAAGGL
jgi:hypothetical protein